ncbi:MAG: hypothetical protein IKK52_00620 [Alphaproteobacteria bacterium]|nr:hypothetical protein [Alphaproteobacteria bacterium]
MKKTNVSSSIINSMKNIMAKTKRRFFGASARTIKDEKVTFEEAVDIQKEAYSKSIKRSSKQNCTPPYMELSAQLLAEETQIFQAAANHLAAIAASRPKYAQAIKSIFAEVIANRRLSAEKLEYIKRKLDNI